MLPDSHIDFNKLLVDPNKDVNFGHVSSDYHGKIFTIEHPAGITKPEYG